MTRKTQYTKYRQTFAKFTYYRQEQEVRVCENNEDLKRTSLVIQLTEEK